MFCSLHADLAHGCGTEGHIESLPAVLPLRLAGRGDHAEVSGGILQESSPPLSAGFRLAVRLLHWALPAVHVSRALCKGNGH